MERIMRFLGWINIAIDILALNIAMLASYWILLGPMVNWGQQAVPYVLIVNFLWLFLQSIFKLYDNYLHRNSISIYKQTINAFVVFAISLSFLLLLARQNIFDLQMGGSLSFYALCLSIFGPLLCTNRIIVLLFRKNSRRKKAYARKNVVIVGPHHSSKTLNKLFTVHDHSLFNVMGVFHDREETDRPVHNLYKGSTVDCIPFMKNNRVDEIFCTLPGVSKSDIDLLMHEADKNLTRFRLVPDYYEYFNGNITIEMIDDIPIMSNRTEPLENIVNALVKRMFDIAFSMLVIVFVMSWLVPIIAVLIKMGSEGPVFFTQLRSGRDNKPFYCLKFRSMAVNAFADTQQASRNDKRVTVLGAFLRKTSLDELPQFFNVLWGHMSVVGPRPHMLVHTQEYSQLIDKFMVRHFLKPGITGWAQINGLRGETRSVTDMVDRVEADVWYLENWSFLLDMKIIFLTVWNIFKGEKNAY